MLGWFTPLRVALAVATLKVALHLAALTRYGYFRDELYYLACRQHLAFGYVDHPPLSIALLGSWTAVAGDSLASIRILAALIGAATMVITAFIVIELGGGALAALLACVALLVAPGRLGFDQYYSMNAIDGLAWAFGAWLALRAIRNPRNWLGLGIVLGLGVLNKWSVLWLGAGLALGLLVAARDALRTRWPWIAVAIAVGLALPNFAWQAAHGWPTLEFMKNALAHKYVRESTGALLWEAMMMMNPAIIPIWGAGLIAPWVVPRLERARLLAIAFVTTVVIVVAAKGKAEYLVAAFPLAIAPGAVAWEIALERRGRMKIVAACLVAAAVALGALALPFALPILPLERFVAYQKWLGVEPRSSEKKELGRLPQKYADMHGWPELVHAAELAYARLSADEKEGVTIWALTGGYGPAAAIDVLGARVGLPHAISSHNSYWLWGWGDGDGRTVIVLGDHPRMRALFEELTLVTTVECGDCMPYENHKPVFVGRRMRKPFASFWLEAKNYD